MEQLFICLFFICISSLMRCLFKFFSPFFSWAVFLLWSFKCSLCILDSSPLLDVSFANIFSQPLAGLLILLTLSFAEVFNLNEVPHQWFLLWIMLMVLYPKRHQPYPRSFRFSSILSSKNFRVLHLKFRSMIHFELIFVKGVKSRFNFFFSSRRRHTRFKCDWSSDVCSSDLFCGSC